MHAELLRGSFLGSVLLLSWHRCWHRIVYYLYLGVVALHLGRKHVHLLVVIRIVDDVGLVYGDVVSLIDRCLHQQLFLRLSLHLCLELVLDFMCMVH